MRPTVDGPSAQIHSSHTALEAIDGPFQLILKTDVAEKLNKEKPSE